MHHFLRSGQIHTSITCLHMHHYNPNILGMCVLALPELEQIPSAFQDGIHVSNVITRKVTHRRAIVSLDSTSTLLKWLHRRLMTRSSPIRPSLSTTMIVLVSSYATAVDQDLMSPASTWLLLAINAPAVFVVWIDSSCPPAVSNSPSNVSSCSFSIIINYSSIFDSI